MFSMLTLLLLFICDILSHQSITYDLFFSGFDSLPSAKGKTGSKGNKRYIDSFFYRGILIPCMAVLDFPRHWIPP